MHTELFINCLSLKGCVRILKHDSKLFWYHTNRLYTGDNCICRRIALVAM